MRRVLDENFSKNIYTQGRESRLVMLESCQRRLSWIPNLLGSYRHVDASVAGAVEGRSSS